MIFDQAQEDVLADESECLLVEAPPGSGKTHTAVRLVGRDIDAGRIGSTQRALVLTFSRSARSQLDSYAAELLTPSQRARSEITNYHAWFWQKVTQYRTSLGLPLQIELATEAERQADVLAAMELEGVQRVSKDKRQLSDYSHCEREDGVLYTSRPWIGSSAMPVAVCLSRRRRCGRARSGAGIGWRSCAAARTYSSTRDGQNASRGLDPDPSLTAPSSPACS